MSGTTANFWDLDGILTVRCFLANVTTIAGTGDFGNTDGPGTVATFGGPAGVAVDVAGSLYVADEENHRIRRIDTTGNVTTIAGTGTPGFADGAGTTTAQFNNPIGVAVDATGNVYVSDRSNHRIRRIDTTGNVTTIAGTSFGFQDGDGVTTARFANPAGLAVDTAGNVYVADTTNHRIRRIDTDGNVTTIAGGSTSGSSDGDGITEARFLTPTGVAVDSAGTVYVADGGNYRIRRIATDGHVTTIAGSDTPGFADGVGTLARFAFPYGVAVDAVGTLYVADSANKRIRGIS